MSLIKSLGIDYIEASADTEADPLYCGPEYMNDWAEEVAELQEKLGAKVATLYSGHGTYTTLGLGHTDPRVQERLNQPDIELATFADIGRPADATP